MAISAVLAASTMANTSGVGIGTGSAAALAAAASSSNVAAGSKSSAKEFAEGTAAIFEHFKGLTFSDTTRTRNDRELTDLIIPVLELLKRHPDTYQYMTEVLKEGAIKVEFCQDKDIPSSAMWTPSIRTIKIRNNTIQDKFSVLDSLMFEFCNAGNKEGEKIRKETLAATSQNHKIYGEKEVSEQTLIQHARAYATYMENSERFAGNKAAELQQKGVVSYGWQIPASYVPRVVKDEKTWLDEACLTQKDHGGFSHFSAYMNTYYEITLKGMDCQIPELQKNCANRLGQEENYRKKIIEFELQIAMLQLKDKQEEITSLKDGSIESETQILKLQQGSGSLQEKIDNLNAGKLEDQFLLKMIENRRAVEAKLHRYQNVKALLEKLMKMSTNDAKQEHERLQQASKMMAAPDFEIQRVAYENKLKHMRETLLAILQSAPKAVRTEAQQKSCVEYQAQVLPLAIALGEYSEAAYKNMRFAEALNQLNAFEPKITALKTSMDTLNQEIASYKKPGLLTWAFSCLSSSLSYCCCSCFAKKPSASATAAEPTETGSNPGSAGVLAATTNNAAQATGKKLN
jgi:hypothetical protein